MNCLHCQTVHAPGRNGALVRTFCRPTRHTIYGDCTGCAGRIEGPRFSNVDGLLRLVCQIIRSSMRAQQYDAAQYWAVIGGMDEEAVKRAVRQART